MYTYLISYDLGLPETYNDYMILMQYIKSYSAWAKPLQSVWLVKTDKSLSQVRDEVVTKIDSNDKVFIVDVTKTGWASYNISKEVVDWIKNSM